MRLHLFAGCWSAVCSTDPSSVYDTLRETTPSVIQKDLLAGGEGPSGIGLRVSDANDPLHFDWRLVRTPPPRLPPRRPGDDPRESRRRAAPSDWRSLRARRCSANGSPGVGTVWTSDVATVCVMLKQEQGSLVLDVGRLNFGPTCQTIPQKT